MPPRTTNYYRPLGWSGGNYKSEIHVLWGCFPGIVLGRLIDLNMHPFQGWREKAMAKREPLGQVTCAPVSELSTSHHNASDMGWRGLICQCLGPHVCKWGLLHMVTSD